jgi:transcription initiation factor TFIIIB Brf1 subunit/transcription initiation factor TFIIB
MKSEPAAAPTNDDYGDVKCGICESVLFCGEGGDMPDVCPACGCVVKWELWMPPGEEWRRAEETLNSVGKAIKRLEEAAEILRRFLDGEIDSPSGAESAINSAVEEVSGRESEKRGGKAYES